MRHSVRNIMKTGLVVAATAGALAAGTGTALAATTHAGPIRPIGPVTAPTGLPPGLPTVKPTIIPTVIPTRPPGHGNHGSHADYTKFTFKNNKGKRVTEWVPNDSVGYAVPAYPTDGQSCTIGILSHLPGLEGADSDTADFTRNILWDAWQLVPGSDCLDYLINQIRHHHHPLPQHKAPVGD